MLTIVYYRAIVLYIILPMYLLLYKISDRITFTVTYVLHYIAEWSRIRRDLGPAERNSEYAPRFLRWVQDPSVLHSYTAHPVHRRYIREVRTVRIKADRWMDKWIVGQLCKSQIHAYYFHKNL